MARYILIDNSTGYVFGDTADLPASHVFSHDGPAGDEFRAGDMAKNCAPSPIMAAQWLDEATVGAFGRTYTQHGPDYAPVAGEDAYHVYRADVRGSEAVPVVTDGQDQEMIDAVERDCIKVAVVTIAA